MEKPKYVPKDRITIDKIFNCLKLFYGSRFKCIDGTREEYEKTIWQSALANCTDEEIRQTLVKLKRAAEINQFSVPPHALKFWHYCKGELAVPIYEERRKQKLESPANRLFAKKSISANTKKLADKFRPEY